MSTCSFVDVLLAKVDVELGVYGRWLVGREGGRLFDERASEWLLVMVIGLGWRVIPVLF